MTRKQIFNTARNGITHLVAKHPAAVAVAVAVLAFVLWQFGAGFVSGVRSALTGAQVERTEGQAHAASDQAGAAIGEANETAIERRVNDRVRELTIKPEVERAARRAGETNERVKGARANYEEAIKTNNLRGGDDLRALRRRNCADLADLYPGERFARCQ